MGPQYYHPQWGKVESLSPVDQEIRQECPL